MRADASWAHGGGAAEDCEAQEACRQAEEDAAVQAVRGTVHGAGTVPAWLREEEADVLPVQGRAGLAR